MTQNHPESEFPLTPAPGPGSEAMISLRPWRKKMTGRTQTNWKRNSRLMASQHLGFKQKSCSVFVPDAYCACNSTCNMFVHLFYHVRCASLLRARLCADVCSLHTQRKYTKSGRSVSKDLFDKYAYCTYHVNTCSSQYIRKHPREEKTSGYCELVTRYLDISYHISSRYLVGI